MGKTPISLVVQCRASQGVYSYIAYGLGIHSTLPLPELVAADRVADVTIRLGRIDPSPSEQSGLGSCLRATAREVLFFWEEVGLFQVWDGREIVVDPAPGVEERILRLFILGPALGLLLHQRGLLILHASAVQVGGAAVAFLGGPGWGKSTTAAAMHTRGHAIVADDVLAIELADVNHPVVHPGFPQLKLWPEAAATLGDAPEALPRLHPRLEKRARRDARGFPQIALLLERIYVLAEGTHQEIEPLRPAEAFVELVRHSYVARLLKATGAASLHFDQCGVLANAVPVRRLQTPRSLALLPDLARIIERDLAGG